MRILIIVSTVSMMLSSCVYNEDKVELPVPVKNDDVTYTNYVKDIIANNNCLSCHVVGYNTDGTPAANRDFSSYSGLKQAVNDGVFQERVIIGVQPTMPLGFPELSQDIKDKLAKWINQGTRE